MRIPTHKRHYLTDCYIHKFGLKKKPFYNVDPEKHCFVKVKHRAVRVSGKIKNNNVIIYTESNNSSLPSCTRSL